MRHLLDGHAVMTANELGWSMLRNGELLTTAENAGYELFVTTDTNLKYQQNLDGRRIGIVVLCTTSWPRIKAAPRWCCGRSMVPRPACTLKSPSPDASP